MISPMKHKHLITFGSVMVVAWVVGTFLFIYFWPHLVTNRYKRAILVKGSATAPSRSIRSIRSPKRFLQIPFTIAPPRSSKLMTTGVNHDTLLTVGWLDLSKGPQVLHVPDMAGRYYSVQFTDPFDVNFAYVGTRTTGTQGGRLPHHRSRLERTGAERHDADILAEQFGARYRPRARVQRQRSPDRLQLLRNRFRSFHLPFRNPASNISDAARCARIAPFSFSDRQIQAFSIALISAYRALAATGRLGHGRYHTDLIGGKGGTRTLDPGIMSAVL